MSIAQLRTEYARAALSERDVDADPIIQFSKWFDEAQHAEVHEPNAMALATTGADGIPSARIMLLKGVDARGFVFFTDYRSRKAQELASSANAGLCFWWGPLERQVRVTGTVSRLPVTESAAYFRTRPLGSRIGAHASQQSRELVSREELEARVAELARTLGDDPPLPDHWGGFLVAPIEVEFWQGRPSRLHDRVQYRRSASGTWTRRRLSP